MLIGFYYLTILILLKIKKISDVRISIFAICPYYGTYSIISKDQSSYSFNAGDTVDAHQ